MVIPVEGDWTHIISHVLPLAQTVIAAILGYISKLLRDMRTDLALLDSRLGKSEVMQTAQMKVIDTLISELRREQDSVIRRLERVEERAGKS